MNLLDFRKRLKYNEIRSRISSDSFSLEQLLVSQVDADKKNDDKWQIQNFKLRPNVTKGSPERYLVENLHTERNFLLNSSQPSLTLEYGIRVRGGKSKYMEHIDLVGYDIKRSRPYLVEAKNNTTEQPVIWLLELLHYWIFFDKYCLPEIFGSGPSDLYILAPQKDYENAYRKNTRNLGIDLALKVMDQLSIATKSINMDKPRVTWLSVNSKSFDVSEIDITKRINKTT